MKKIVLFDIDWTLMKSSKAHGIAFKEAFKHVYGIETSHEKLNPQGWTDKKIIFEALRLEGLDDKSIEEKLNEAFDVMNSYFVKACEQYPLEYPLEIMPGVESLLNYLHSNNVIIGVLTGNIEQIAKAKLRISGINKYFTLGYFGDYSVKRDDLALKAVNEAEKQGIPKKNVFIIGDTPLDIIAGKKSGARTIGVATGSFLEKELMDSGPDLVIKGFYDVEPVKKIIMGN